MARLCMPDALLRQDPKVVHSANISCSSTTPQKIGWPGPCQPWLGLRSPYASLLGQLGQAPAALTLLHYTLLTHALLPCMRTCFVSTWSECGWDRRVTCTAVVTRGQVSKTCDQTEQRRPPIVFSRMCNSTCDRQHGMGAHRRSLQFVAVLFFAAFAFGQPDVVTEATPAGE